jgi:hypothetical protein
MTLDRRSFFAGLIAAPAIVRLPSLMLMPRAPWPPIIRPQHLICNGALVRVKDYPELFAAIGYTYGSGTGGRFCLPDIGPISWPVTDRAPWPVAPMRYLINAESDNNGPAGTLRISV